MNLFERVQMLCTEKEMNPSRLEIELGLGRGTLYTWRKSSPSTEKAAMVADYFGVSVDYLLGKTDIRNINDLDMAEELEDELFEKRKLLFDISKKATEEDLDQIIKIVETFVDE